MSHQHYDSHPSSPTHRLIDLIPDHQVAASDEDEAFYLHDDDDYLIHPKWKALIQRTTNQVPRRVRRYSVIYLLLLFVAWVSWTTHFGPRYTQYKMEQAEMDAPPKGNFGSNMRPHFKDMIQLKTLDENHLPHHKKRLVFVGDVHGCRHELEELLRKVEFNDKTDHLILTGDIIAKGPDSPGVVHLAQKLGASCVRGNHEDKVLLSIAESNSRQASSLDTEEQSELPPHNLDEEAAASHGDKKLRKLAKQFSKGQIHWLQQCPVILRVGKVPHMGEVVVVHAGLVPGIALEQQDPFQCMNMRTIDLKTHIPSETRDHTHWEKFWNHQQKKLSHHERTTVIYGHDAKRGLNVQKYSFGLDASCVRGGHLTAMVVDSTGNHKIVQVKCKTNYTE